MSLKPRKSLGQHFLKDPNISRKIVASLDAASGDTVIEIGPGTGSLTEWLIAKYPSMRAIEIDEQACEILKARYPGLTLLHKDILNFNWATLRRSSPLHIIGNLPYYITSPILFSLLESRKLITEAVLMVQKEVAHRLVAVPSTKDYGILSVQLQLFASIDLLFNVSRKVFHPEPRVDSSVVKLHFDKVEPACNISLLRRVVRTSFNQRRKKLKNALKPILVRNIDTEIDFNFNRRAEELNPLEFIDLTNLLSDAGILSI